MALQIFAFHGFFLALIALLVRFGGNFPTLAGTKRFAVKDIAAYNKWAGNRLLLLPVAALVIARFSVGSLAASTFGLILLWAVIIAVLVWVCGGVKEFS